MELVPQGTIPSHRIEVVQVASIVGRRIIPRRAFSCVAQIRVRCRNQHGGLAPVQFGVPQRSLRARTVSNQNDVVDFDATTGADGTAFG